VSKEYVAPAMVIAMAVAVWAMFDLDERALLVPFMWPSRGFDRVRTGDFAGNLFECFDPPWWKLHRWAWWLAKGRKLRRDEHGVLISRGNKVHVVRAFVPADPYPKVRFRGRRLG
jgi:hypothetical protein